MCVRVSCVFVRARVCMCICVTVFQKILALAWPKLSHRENSPSGFPS